MPAKRHLPNLFFRILGDFFRFKNSVILVKKALRRPVETRGRKSLPVWVKFERFLERKHYELDRWHRRTTDRGDEIIHRFLSKHHFTRGKGRPRKYSRWSMLAQLQRSKKNRSFSPKIKSLKLPQIKLPRIKLSQLHLPQLKLPKIKLWKIAKLPRLPKLPKWSLRWPKAPKIHLPKVQLPKVVLPALPTLPTLPKLPQPPTLPKLPKIRFTQPVWLLTLRRYKHTLAAVSFTLAIIGLGTGGYFYIFVDLPSALDLTKKEQAQTTRIVDRNGELLYRIYNDENRTLVPLNRISPYLIQATISIEDRDFYHHTGFSLKGIGRALLANIEGKEIQQGGSTITQQLVKNRLLSPEKTARRKIREIILAIIVEGTYSKKEILEMYFNQVAYGGSTYGAEEAAWRYFNKPAADLSLAESALLSGLPAAPSVYSPFGSNPELAYARQEEVLRRMLEDKYITKEQADEARAQKLAFRDEATDIKAPHFVMYVKQLLSQQYGEDVLTTGGLEVRTTLDLAVQNQSQKLVTDEMKQLQRLRINNGAALVTNPRTGEILAMVGSKDYFDFAHDGQVNVTLRPRQPGSSIKPLAYALALQKGKTPASQILDAPTAFQSAGSPPYVPKNYDGKFHGNVSIRESLASSYNIPAVKTLNEVGLNNFIDFAQQLGITTWKDRSRFGLSLSLGSGEVRMVDLAQAYSAFPNGGYPVQPNPILEVKNQRGEVLYHNQCALDGQNCWQGAPVVSPLTAYQITDILSDNRARTPAFGPSSVLYIPNQQIAVKTGTTNSLRDNWTVGYSSNRLVAVWVGNNDNTPMSYVASGITGASPIWNKIIRSLLDEKKPHQFALPAGLVKVAICAKTNTLPCAGCPNVREEIFVEGTQPQKACNSSYFAQQQTTVNGTGAIAGGVAGVGGNGQAGHQRLVGQSH